MPPVKILSAKFIKGIRGTDPILSDGIPQTAFVGRSNVGKSSLINALLGSKDLVKVGKRPGKTTEINFFEINRKFYLVDLPGYGYARTSPDEKEKIRKLIIWYLCYSEAKPQRIVLILDVKAGLTDFDKEMLQLLKEKRHPHLLVVNKIDKLGKEALEAQLKLIARESGEKNIFPCSTKTGTGIKEIFEKLFTPSLHTSA